MKTETDESKNARILTVSVRTLVGFLLRSGDLVESSGFRAPNRAQQGTRGHRRLQKARGDNYRAEVTLSQDFPVEDWVLRVRGRADGLLTGTDLDIIEEIKTTQGLWDREDPHPLHLAQARVYAALHLAGNARPKIATRIVYLDLESGLTVDFNRSEESGSCIRFLEQLVGEYSVWALMRIEWTKKRNAAVACAVFPHGGFREGQRAMSVAVFRAITGSGRPLIEAPTGIGKSLAALFPAAKALGLRHCDRIFYLTARTVGALAAAKALRELADSGMLLRAVLLRARDKSCFCATDGCRAGPLDCPYAKGYYDRNKDALRDLLDSGCNWDPGAVSETAQKWNVCPFELSLDATEWADVVVCDYNYAFDPRVSLERHFGEQPGGLVLLCDEAHHLPDRAREMFSAEVRCGELSALAESVHKTHRRLAGAIRGFASAALQTPEDPADAVPETVVKSAFAFREEAAEWLALDEKTPFRNDLLQHWFECTHLLRMEAHAGAGVGYAWLPVEGSTDRQLRCLDPGPMLAPVLSSVRAAVFFSATLTPCEYFHEMLGGDAFTRLLSPFPAENLCICTTNTIEARAKARMATLERVAAMIATLISGQRGNYLVFAPSFAYLDILSVALRKLLPETDFLLQSQDMREEEKTHFLEKFADPDRAPVTGLAVVGGIFAEGVDLAGSRLIGVAVVGTGLPAITTERDRMKTFFSATGRDGFGFAYETPGMIKVLQAVGRVIRSEDDRGVALLVDARFASARLRAMMPPHWKPHPIRDTIDLETVLGGFWGRRMPARKQDL